MGVREQTREIRLRQWAEIMQARQNSGQTVHAFCVDNEINEKRFYYWQRKLREAACLELLASTQSYHKEVERTHGDTPESVKTPEPIRAESCS